MKKIKTLLAIPMLLTLVACSKSPKDEFLDAVKKQQGQDKGAYEYTIKIDDVSGDLGAQLEAFKGKTVTATASQDLKAELVGLTVDLSSFDSSFSDFNLVYAGDKAYMNVAPIAQFAAGVSAENLEGKFVDIEEFSGEEMPSLKSIAEEGTSDTAFFEELDEKHFSKDGDKVSLSLTIDELLDFSSKAVEKAGTETEGVTAEQMKTYMDLAKASLDDSSKFVITVDGKGNGEAKIQLKTAAGVGESASEIKLSLSYKSVDYKEPKVPAKSDIVSQEELSNLMTSAAGVSDEELKMTDEEFNELYSSLEGEVANATKEEIQAYITGIAPYLTEEQNKKMQELLKKASDA